MWWSPEHPHFAHRGRLALLVEPESPGSTPSGENTHLTITVETQRDDGACGKIRVECCVIDDILRGLPALAEKGRTQFALGIETPSLDLYARFDAQWGVMVSVGAISLPLGSLENRVLNTQGSAPFLNELIRHIPPGPAASTSQMESDIRKYSKAIQISSLPDTAEPWVGIEAVWHGFAFWMPAGEFVQVIREFLNNSLAIVGGPTTEDDPLTTRCHSALRALERGLGLDVPRTQSVG